VRHFLPISRQLASSIAVAASLLAVLACGRDTASPKPTGVQHVTLTPDVLHLGRGDQVQVTAHATDYDGREVTGRTVTFASADSKVAIIGSPDNVVGRPGFLIAVGPGSTTISATVDGVTGTAHIDVVAADTTFELTHFNGTVLPVLVAADSVIFDGQKEFAEVYVDAGTLVLSGLLQERYTITVRVSQYHVFTVGGIVQRELRFRSNADFDRGVVTTNTDGSLSMLSEFIGPHLEHSATRTTDGYVVHFQEPGEDVVHELRYRRVSP
jgi:hypothetical protein